MIEPKPLLQLLAGSRLVEARDAVKATIATLLPGVTVVAHPGKLDINDVVQKTIVQAPGVAVGWTRSRQAADPGGTWSDVVDFVAYIVVEGGLTDRSVTPPITHPRELVAHAIGGVILQALRDPELCFWGLLQVEPPSMDPGPALTPLFTMRDDQNAVAVYAVTWSQALANDGAPWFDGPGPIVHGVGGADAIAAGVPGAVAGDDELVFDLPAGDVDGLPPEIRAYIRRDLADGEGGGPARGAGP